jgi:hypothetical protein
MAIGLSRVKNLSERNLNLKTALQKLYASGIENDISLFSLSSSVESQITSGELSNTTAQIFGLRNEVLTTLGGSAQLRTKFLTNFFTLTDLNEVYFNKFTLNASQSEEIVLPKSSQNGELYSIEIISGGKGFYFENSDGTVFTNPSSTLEVKNVSLKGVISGQEGAKASVVFAKHSVAGIPSSELTNFTPGNTDRYSIFSIQITSPSVGYIFPENLELVLGEVELVSNDLRVVLKKQLGSRFFGQPEILKSRLYTYQVRNSGVGGFFIFDQIENKYIYLGKNTPPTGFTQQESDSIKIKRFDGINVFNFFQFKFAQSAIWLQRAEGGVDGTTGGFRITGDSISGEINKIAAVTNNLQQRAELGVQNTRRPTLPTSVENILGYKYNSFEGQDLVIWQRVVIRDPDYILDPTQSSITGTRLRTLVNNFEIDSLENPGQKIRVPGLFIKVGAEYFRAFSTTDKPFFAETNTGTILNPKTTGASSTLYSLSAESLPTGSSGLYSYDTVISQLAQRISPGGVNGAFYYHRPSPINARVVATKNGSNTDVNIFALPLFTLIAS